MTKKDLMKFQRQFNDLVQKLVNGKPAFKIQVNEIDYLGGYEVFITTDCLLWPQEVAALQVICEGLCLQCCIVMRYERIEIR